MERKGTIRRLVLAGLAVGCLVAFFHNHWESMQHSHDSNPFAHHNNGGRGLHSSTSQLNLSRV